MTELSPQIDAKYQILEKLGEGGMGSVFKVRHRLLGQLRVVKVIRASHAEDTQVRERFNREARAAIELHHPNIAQIHDFDITPDGRAHLVMELIEGLTFQKMLARRRPPLALALEMGQQALAALGYLHGKGYLHRDVSPDNLMLTRSYAGTPRVKLIDLGLVKRNAETLELTATNMFVGKVRYASPELFRRPAMQPQANSDLYSFAVVFYEMLTGACPIQGASFEELMAAHLLDQPRPFEETDPEGRIPEGLRGATLRAMAKDPAERFASAEDFRQELLPFLEPEAIPDFDEIETLYEHSFQRSPELEAVGDLDVPTVAAGLPLPDAVQPAAPKPAPRRPTPRSTAPPEPTRRLGKSSGRQAGSRLGRFAKRAGSWGLLLVVAGALGWLSLGRGDDLLDRLVDADGSPDGTSASRPATDDGDGDGDGDGATNPGTTVAQGRLLLTARPWAEVSEIVDSEGRPIAFAQPLHTPALLNLPAGSYTVRLSHPDLEIPHELPVEIPPSGTVRENFDLGRFDVDIYFDAVGLRDSLEQAGL